MATSQDLTNNNSEDPVVREGKERFKRCQDWESNARNLFLDDLKFAEADSDNGYQWPNDLRKARDLDERPSLTLNITRQHNLVIINDIKDNMPQIKISGTGNGATYEAAQTIGGLCRYVERNSNASTIYGGAAEMQVKAGWGCWRVVTDYAGDDTFNQEIYIRPIRDPLTVFIDPDAKEKDKSDAKFAFIFEDMVNEEFDKLFPEYKEKRANALGNDDNWVTPEHTRIAEYFRCVPKKDKLIRATIPGGVLQGRVSELRKDPDKRALIDAVIDDPSTIQREIVDTVVEWKLIVADTVIRERIWPGRYIPVIKVVGEETVIEGEYDCKGHTRAMKDPQRIYNYWSSSAVEHVALQGKTPYIAASEAIEGYEEYWETANKDNYSVLPYNAYDDNGQRIDAPKRAENPTMAQAYIQGMQVAQTEIQMVSGQFEANMGQQGNERTGAAINAKQKKGDASTSHYRNNLSLGIQFTGKILVDLFPKIYDTTRIVQIMAVDGTDMEVEIDPAAQKAYMETTTHAGVVAKRVLNPSIGKYWAEADVGPAYATRREEAFNAISLILTQGPELVSICGDLLFQSADFPLADEMARRLKRMVPKQALGDGPSQEEQAMQQQIQQLTSLLGEASTQITGLQLKLKGKDEMRDIDVFKADTDRLKALLDFFSPEQQKALTAQAVNEAMEASMAPILSAIEGALAQMQGVGIPNQGVQM